METTLREVHFCKTCEFALPYCVRSDREFCGKRCRSWWYLHPGQKRLDFAPGEDSPPRRKRGQPKTLAEALAALAEAQAEVARLEAEARKWNTKEHKQRNNWSDFQRKMTEQKVQSRRELDALRDEVATLTERLTASEQSRAEKGEQEEELHKQVETLKKELAEAKEAQKELREEKEQLIAEHKEAMAAETQKQTAAEATIAELHEVAESLEKDLAAEQELRAAAERRGDELSADIERLAKDGMTTLSQEEQTSLFESWDRHKSAELRDTRQHRDAALVQRERYARRILRMMSPGRYLEYAMAAGYDVTKDPLIASKGIELMVESKVAEVQRQEKPLGRARELDTEQTIDEQAFAAAMAFRWQHINRPHRERRGKIKWIVVGFQLDAESEKYLRKLTQARTRRLERSLGM